MVVVISYLTGFEDGVVKCQPHVEVAHLLKRQGRDRMSNNPWGDLPTSLLKSILKRLLRSASESTPQPLELFKVLMLYRGTMKMAAEVVRLTTGPSDQIFDVICGSSFDFVSGPHSLLPGGRKTVCVVRI